MNNCFSMNIAWPSEKRYSVKYYRECFEACRKYNIRCIRIFLVPWGLNPIEHANDLEVLCEILCIANEFQLEIVLVLDTYVNYVKSSYRDFINSDYSWYTNPFSQFSSLADFLCARGRTKYVEKMLCILREIKRFDNLRQIELCNEIDQIESERKRIISWINNSINVLSKVYGDRFDFRVSISDYRVYNYYSKRIKCKCDIHSYRFPYNTALENYEYLNKKFPLAWISEFGCFSDFAYGKTIESKTFFSAMLLCARFEKTSDFPAPWWWETILTDSMYMSIYSYLKKLEDEFVKRKMVDFSVAEVEQIQKSNIREKNKIRYRLSVLKKNPKYIKQEWPAITKFVRKKFFPKYNHRYTIVGYESAIGDLYYVLETYVPVEVKYKHSDSEHGLLICRDMTRSQEMIPIELDEVKTLREGAYLLIVCRSDKDKYK